MVTVSGLMPNASEPNQLPVRPKPLITSSTMKRCRLGEHRLDLVEIGLGRHDHAARPHHRLGDEGGDGVGPSRRISASRLAASRAANSASLSPGSAYRR